MEETVFVASPRYNIPSSWVVKSAVNSRKAVVTTTLVALPLVFFHIGSTRFRCPTAAIPGLCWLLQSKSKNLSTYMVYTCRQQKPPESEARPYMHLSRRSRVPCVWAARLRNIYRLCSSYLHELV
ncbi:unnamed protein product [Mesocestoides corti]|uniref:Transmembrane protein n=1 Tax=Mesocestoides corti TaxID=53468 RepID=A0A0R3UDV8_MESCO|nr:unnamed protein product [Mesocestoides corti]